MAVKFKLAFPAQSGVTANANMVSGRYDLVPRTDTKSPGFWCPITITPGSIWAELDFMFTGPVPSNVPLMVKAGSFALKIVDGKIYLDSVTSASDVAAGFSLSSDKEAGSTTIKPNVRYKVKLSYDAATALVLVTLNGYEEIRFYRIRKPSAIGLTSDKLTVLEKTTGASVYSLTVGDDRPSYRGMRLVVRSGRLFIDRVDIAFIGKELRLFVESPYGVIIQEWSWHIVRTDLVFPLTLETGTNSVTIQYGIFQQTLLIQSGYEPEMPSFFTGFYNVRNGDMALAKANGAMVACSDWVLQRTVPNGIPNTPENRLRLYADAANSVGMGIVAVCCIGTGKDTPLLPEFANHPGIAFLLSGDESYGYLPRFAETYHAVRTQAKKALFGSLNKFSAIPEFGMYHDGLFLNIYNLPSGDTRKITELVNYAKLWDIPTAVVLGFYDNVQPSIADVKAQIKAVKDSGAVGCIVFELDHREKEGQAGWYMPVTRPDLLQAIKESFQS